MKKRGFTLIELVVIIVILGLFAAIAIPKYYDLQQQAQQAAEEGVVGGIRSGISSYYTNECATGTCGYPSALDSASVAACSTSNPCFGDVLAQPITDDWTKASATTYTGPDTTTGLTYTYDSSGGTFNGA